MSRLEQPGYAISILPKREEQIGNDKSVCIQRSNRFGCQLLTSGLNAYRVSGSLGKKRDVNYRAPQRVFSSLHFRG
jgi:hypothetical protein